MDPMKILRSPRAAFVIMAFIVACGLVFGHRYFGWLGVLFVGVVGLMISMRAEMFEETGDPHERNGGHVVDVYARQLEHRKAENEDARMRREGDAFHRHILHRVINTVFAAISMLGGAMYVLREL